MTDSVWWYVLAGFLLGFILSTLWEWLYFRRRRMRIENRRIAELEATVRSLSTVSQSAETSTSPGFAAGYQSPMVFLEGEDDDVDTVEVIVPASPEPLDFDEPVTGQSAYGEQTRAETQFVAARPGPVGRTPASNGNGLTREAPGEAAKVEPVAVVAGRAEPAQSTVSPAALAAGTAAAAAIWAAEKDRPAEVPVTEATTAIVPAAETPAPDRTLYGSLPEEAAQEQTAQEPVPGLVGDLAPSRHAAYVSPAPDEAEQAPAPAAAESEQDDQLIGSAAPAAAAALLSAEPAASRQTVVPLEPEEGVEQPQGGDAPQTTAAINTVDAQPPDQPTVQPTDQPVEVQPSETQPVLVQGAPSPPPVEYSDRQEPEQDAGLSPAGVAVLVSALASKLAGEQQPPEASQPSPSQQPSAQAEPQAAQPQPAAPGPEPMPESAQAARMMPGVYDVPDPQPETQQDSPGDGTSIRAEEDPDPATRAGSSVAPAEIENVERGAAPITDSGETPQSVVPQEREPALPLSAILPRAEKPAPLSKNTPARHTDAAQASALAAPGIEPEIEQVSNQLDDLIESINGLIERTQPLLDQPVQQAPPTRTPATPAGPIAADDYDTGGDFGTEEDTASGVTGPYSAQNLSRMEYGLVQLMQAARRLGREVRSAF